MLALLVGAAFLRILPSGGAAKEVSIIYNGLHFNEKTYADGLAQLLDTWQVDPSCCLVTPPPQSKLVSGMTITIQDKDRVSLSPIVTSNLAHVQKEAQKPHLAPVGPLRRGLATWYRYKGKWTTASRDFPRGTKLKVTAIHSGKSVLVEVNDWGPQPWTGAVLDLNKAAFAELAPLGAGKIEVSYQKMVYAR